GRIDVYIINSAVNLESQDCTLLILDEIHKYLSSTFRNVFKVFRYKYILGLTASIDWTDPRTRILDKLCPVIYTIPMEECLRNGWVAPYVVYNVGVEMSED